MNIRRSSSQSGGTLFVSLLVLAAISFMAAYTFRKISPQVRVAYQNAAWQEARLSAESGVDAAIGDLLRNETGNTSGLWEGWRQKADNGAIIPVQPGLITRALSGTVQLLQSTLGLDLLGGAADPDTTTRPIFLDNVKVSVAKGIPSEVDVQLWALRPTTLQSKPVIRIRSMATSALPPTAYEAPLGLDTALRRLNLRSTRPRVKQDDIGAPSTIALPNVSRTVEVLVEPVTPFELALWTAGTMSLPSTGKWVLDSYDSRDPQKSGAGGIYPGAASPAAQATGILATNQPRPGDALYGTLVSANGARVKGWIATNGGDNPDTPERENVSGGLAIDPAKVRSDFQREMPPILRGKSTNELPPPLLGLPLIPGTSTSPTCYHFTGDAHAFTIAAPIQGTTGSIRVLIDGNWDVNNGPLVIPPNVACEVYVRGSVNFYDSAINSGQGSSNRPAQLLIFGEGQPLISQAMTLKARGTGNICAAFYGPGYDMEIEGSVNWNGALVGRSYISPWGGDGGIHYDQSLALVGPPVSFRVVRYVDDVRQ